MTPICDVVMLPGLAGASTEGARLPVGLGVRPTQPQELTAKFIGRSAAFEKALQVIIGSPNPNIPMGELLKMNLTMRRQHLGNDLAKAGIDAKHLAAAISAAVEAENAIHRWVQSGKYFPLP